MTELPTWIALSLREPLDAAGVVARVPGAETSRYGIAFPGGFLGRVEPEPWPEWFADRALLDEDVTFGPATLLVSGGTNELDRDRHAQPPKLRELGREMAMNALAVTEHPDVAKGPIESAASRKMTRLTELVCALAPLATAVILTRANHLVMSSSYFATRADNFLDGASYMFPLWSCVKVHGDVLASTGMWPFALPDVAMRCRPGDDRGARVKILGELQREMVAEGWWPADGDTFDGRTLRRAWDSVWIAESHDDRDKQFERFAQLRRILGPSVHHHRSGPNAVEHFLIRGAPSYAITNRLSETVEIAIRSRDLGPWANHYLDLAAAVFGGAKPVQPYDRIVFGDGPIPAAVVWPFGHLNPLHDREPTVQLWELLPILPDELAAFRARPGAQQAWCDERDGKQDFVELLARWRT